MRSAAVALVAAVVFFAGVLFGAAGRSSDRPLPQPVVLQVVGGGAGTGGPREGRNGPAPDSLDVQEVKHEVREGEVEDYGDHGAAEDDSGPGSIVDEDPEVDDSSGPGSGDADSGDDNSGPGSDSSGSGSSGSSGSGSSGSGSDGSDSG